MNYIQSECSVEVKALREEGLLQITIFTLEKSFLFEAAWCCHRRNEWRTTRTIIPIPSEPIATAAVLHIHS